MNNDELITLMIGALLEAGANPRAILHGETQETRVEVAGFLLSFTSGAMAGVFPASQLQALTELLIPPPPAPFLKEKL